MASDSDDVDIIHVIFSNTITTRPTSIEIKALGTQIPGDVTSFDGEGLTANQSYYGWAMAVDKSGNESLTFASNSSILSTDGGILRDFMYNADLNAACSLRKLYIQYTGPHV